MNITSGRLFALAGLGDCYDDEGNYIGPGCDGSSVITTPAVPDCIWGGVYPNCAQGPNIQSSTPVAYGSPSSGVATQAQSQAGLTALSQLTNAALSNIAKLPGQAALQPGQTLTMGPNGTYQITASGVAPGASLGLSQTGLSGLLPFLLIGGALLFAMKGGR